MAAFLIKSKEKENEAQTKSDDVEVSAEIVKLDNVEEEK